MYPIFVQGGGAKKRKGGAPQKRKEFNIFIKSPVADEKVFCEAAKEQHILIVPGSSFACPGYVRIAYCVAHETNINSMPGFKALAKEFLG